MVDPAFPASLAVWVASNTDPVNLAVLLLVAWRVDRSTRAIQERCPYHPDPSEGTRGPLPDGGDRGMLRADAPVRFLAWLKDLSYAEVHMFTLGFYSGLVAVRPRRREVPEGPGLPDPPIDAWYHRGGYVIGYVVGVPLKVVAAWVVGSCGLPALGGVLPW